MTPGPVERRERTVVAVLCGGIFCLGYQAISMLPLLPVLQREFRFGWGQTPPQLCDETVPKVQRPLPGRLGYP